LYVIGIRPKGVLRNINEIIGNSKDTDNEQAQAQAQAQDSKAEYLGDPVTPRTKYLTGMILLLFLKIHHIV